MFKTSFSKALISTFIAVQLGTSPLFGIEIAIRCKERNTPEIKKKWHYKGTSGKVDLLETSSGWKLRSCFPEVGHYTTSHSGEHTYTPTTDCLWIKDYPSFAKFSEDLDDAYLAHHEGPTGLKNVSKNCSYDRSNFHLVFEQVKELEILMEKVTNLENSLEKRLEKLEMDSKKKF